MRKNLNRRVNSFHAYPVKTGLVFLLPQKSAKDFDPYNPVLKQG